MEKHKFKFVSRLAIVSLAIFSGIAFADSGEDLFGNAVESWQNAGAPWNTAVSNRTYSGTYDATSGIKLGCALASPLKHDEWDWASMGSSTAGTVTIPQHVPFEYVTSAGDLGYTSLVIFGHKYIWSWWYGDKSLIVRTDYNDRGASHTFSTLGNHQVAYMMMGPPPTGLQLNGNILTSTVTSVLNQIGSALHQTTVPNSCGSLTANVVPDQTPITYGYADNYYPDTTTAVTFSAGTSYNPVNKRVKLSYTWQFDDGTVLHGATVKRVFATGGTIRYQSHTVTLTASDGYLAGKATLIIHVKDGSATGCTSTSKTICK